MAYRDPEVGRTRDRERFHRRTAERRAQGLCPRCGKQPSVPRRSVCEPCAEKTRVAGRTRAAKLRTAGRPRRVPERARAYERERSRRQTAERIAQGLCTKCGKAPCEPDRSRCERCADKRRAAERARYAEARAAGRLYGGRDPDNPRRNGRDRSSKLLQERRGAGRCIRCGKHLPVEGGTRCGPCRGARRAAEHELYAARRPAGLCVRCGQPSIDGGSRCGSCAVLESQRNQETKNAAARRRYAERRARGECTDCGAPSQGAARCEPCARKSYERSGHFRGIPVWDPSFTVVELGTGEHHGTFDSEAEVAACLTFAKLSYDQVEILSDVSPMAHLIGRG